MRQHYFAAPSAFQYGCAMQRAMECIQHLNTNYMNAASTKAAYFGLAAWRHADEIKQRTLKDNMHIYQETICQLYNNANCAVHSMYRDLCATMRGTCAGCLSCTR